MEEYDNVLDEISKNVVIDTTFDRALNAQLVNKLLENNIDTYIPNTPIFKYYYENVDVNKALVLSVDKYKFESVNVFEFWLKHSIIKYGNFTFFYYYAHMYKDEIIIHFNAHKNNDSILSYGITTHDLPDGWCYYENKQKYVYNKKQDIFINESMTKIDNILDNVDSFKQFNFIEL